MKIAIGYCALTVLLTALSGACAASAEEQRVNSAIVPAENPETRALAAGWLGGGNWLTQHEDINKIGAGGPVDLVFLGDSITQSWGGGGGRNVTTIGGQVWQKHYGNRKAANFGISGDRTEHVLWRMFHGNFAKIKPKLIVLMIGTNNTADNTADEIAIGIATIVTTFKVKLPNTHILLLGIFPRGPDPSDPGRVKVGRVNEIIRNLADGRNVTYMDLAGTFLNGDGSVKTDLMLGDYVHLGPNGYEAWAQAIEPTVSRILDGKK